MSGPDLRDLPPPLNPLEQVARAVAGEVDEAKLVDIVLRAFADVAQSDRVALFLLNETGKTLSFAGGLNCQKRISSNCLVSLYDSPLGEVLTRGAAEFHPLSQEELIPLPASDGIGPKQCLCVPLIGKRHPMKGVITLECVEYPTTDPRSSVLNLLATVASMSLENIRLFHLATIDGLTGLYTRRYFEIRLDEEIARISRHGGSLALLLTDFDDFKQVNDRHGHQQGDLVLRELAVLLRAAIRKGVDLPCRYGGDEFATILPVTDLRGACEMAERLRRGCEGHNVEGGAGAVNVTLSGGVVTLDQAHLVSREELVRRVDAALYEAKQRGRNRICTWQELSQ